MGLRKMVLLGVLSLTLGSVGFCSGADNQENTGRGQEVSEKMLHERGVWLCPKEKRVLSKEEVFQKMDENRVILIGETHTNYEIHRWQLAILAGLYSRNENVVVGFEMFPRRLDPVLAEWVDGKLSKEEFLAKGEWDTVWKYEPELYMPIFDFCRQNRIPMLGINCRRDLVSRVGREGWEAIPVEDRDGLTPAKPASQGYYDYLNSLMSGMKGQASPMPMKFSMDHFIRAQQTWDRAFACNIAKALEVDPTRKVVGIIGKGHLEYGHGVRYQLADLGIEDVLVFIPSFEEKVDWAKKADIGDGLFRLDLLER
jgi:Uncharacterized iron-regulated protein